MKLKSIIFFLIIFFNFSKLDSREYPLSYLKKAFEAFKLIKGQIIVEIGSMRAEIKHDINKIACGSCLDGHSTYFWAYNLEKLNNNSKIYSIDISRQTSQVAKKSCAKFKNIEIVTKDGIEFLKNFDKPIDLLYLDGWDLTLSNYAEKHLEAYLAARKNLHKDSLILIDDTDLYNGGKSRLIMPVAIKDGFKIIFKGRQTLLFKYK